MCSSIRSSITWCRMSAVISPTSSLSMISRRWPKIALRWSFITSSNFSSCLRMSKLRPSTLACARSSDLFTQGWMIASPSFMPSVDRTLSRRSEPKIRIRSSSSDRKNSDRPGSPWRPERPRSWLSIRRLSWRSVPSTNSPPAARTFSFSPACSASIRARSSSGWASGSAFRASITFISTLPPSWMSVPRPAMLVAIVTAPSLPASATICASASCWRAFRTLWGTPSFFSISDSSSDFSMLVVPTRIGWPLAWASLIASTTAAFFSVAVRYTRSWSSIRAMPRLVGTSTTPSL